VSATGVALIPALLATGDIHILSTILALMKDEQGSDRDRVFL